MAHKTKKLVLVIVTNLSINVVSKKATSKLQNLYNLTKFITEFPELKKAPCIYYPVQFQEKSVYTLINLDSKVNRISPNFAKKLGFEVWQTKIGTQKIDSLSLKTFKIVIESFLNDDKLGRSRFFKKTFLLANISIDIDFRMLFFTLSNIEINFLQ